MVSHSIGGVTHGRVSRYENFDELGNCWTARFVAVRIPDSFWRDWSADSRRGESHYYVERNSGGYGRTWRYLCGGAGTGIRI
ncbi:hypothetical protein D3C74_389600 [compost metagenome]